LKKFLSAPEISPFASAALLLLRMVGGTAFMFHGWSKVQSPFGWMGPEAWAPAPLQGLAALSEFGGGLAWILGLLTPLASLGILSTMSVALWTHIVTRGDPFVGRGGPSWELASVYFCVAVLLIAIGPGRFSSDRVLFGRR